MVVTPPEFDAGTKLWDGVVHKELWNFRVYPKDLHGRNQQKCYHLNSISNGLRFAQLNIKVVYNLTLMK